MGNIPKRFEFTDAMRATVEEFAKKPPIIQSEWVKELQTELNSLITTFSDSSKKDIVLSLKETREIWDTIMECIFRKVVNENTPVRIGQLGILAPHIAAPNIRELVTSWDVTGNDRKVQQIRKAAIAARKSVKIKRKYVTAIDGMGQLIKDKKDAIEYLD